MYACEVPTSLHSHHPVTSGTTSASACSYIRSWITKGLRENKKTLRPCGFIKAADLFKMLGTLTCPITFLPPDPFYVLMAMCFRLGNEYHMKLYT